ncbi:lipase family alpha/beta hydrolase [Streptomyces griseoruber]|uniref:lipase family alpha/beta hydrolase n=1 Tax=Streptomyces griseoruber TaxID=1943 RepID=UPI0037B24D89
MTEAWGLSPGEGGTGRRGRRTTVRHLLVLVPGIGGSALHRRDGTPLWAIDPKAAQQPVRALRELAAPGDLLRCPDYDDGVRATELMALPVPGLTRLLGGYRDLRSALFDHFDLDTETYTEFPYDWRRPAAHNALLLESHVRCRLTRLRRRYPDAEAVVVAHSMGGLVAREFLERHDRHRTVRALITLGTPFRGAVKALDFLVNGPSFAKIRFRRLAEEFARLPAVYELLPLYQCIRLGTSPDAPLGGVRDVAHLLPVGGKGHASDAADFLTCLNKSEAPAVTRSVVGFGVPTLQQAVLSGRRLTVLRGSDLLPESHRTADGDGTVPLLSATPRSSEETRLGAVPHNQTHSGLVTGRDALGALLVQIAAVVRDGKILDPGRRAAPPAPPAPHTAPALTLDVADWYDTGEPLALTGRASGYAGRTLWFRLGDHAPTALTVDEDGGFTLRPGPQREGVQRIDLLDAPEGAVLLTDVIEAA